MKFQCYTLGCKVNQYETQAMEQQLLALGHEIAQENCDLYIINTCTVTAVADRKNRTLIPRLRREHPVSVSGTRIHRFRRRARQHFFSAVICDLRFLFLRLILLLRLLGFCIVERYADRKGCPLPFS